MNVRMPSTRSLAARWLEAALTPRGRIVGSITVLTAIILLRFRAGALLEVIYTLGDNGSEFYPVRTAAAEAFRRLEFLLWTPQILAGYPMFANPQAAVFYPLNWILALSLPSWAVLNYSFIVHMILAAVGMYFYLRIAARTTSLAAISGALIFTLNGNRIFESYAFAAPVAWIPLIFLCIHKFVRELRFEYLLLGIILNALQSISGSPPMAFVINVGCLLYGILIVLIRQRADGYSLRQLIALTAATPFFFLLSFALIAVQALPTRELALMTPRAAPTWEFISFGSFEPWTIGRVLSGGQIEYLGLIPIILAGVALVYSRRRDVVWLAASLSAICLVLSFGKYAPLYQILFDVVPGFDKFRIPFRFWVLFTFAVATLAALGLDSLLRWKGWQRGGLALRNVLAVCVIAALAIDYWKLPLYQYDPKNSIRRSMLLRGSETMRFLEAQSGLQRTLSVAENVDIWSGYEVKRRFVKDDSAVETSVHDTGGYMTLQYVPYYSVWNRLEQYKDEQRLRFIDFLNVRFVVTNEEYPSGFPSGALQLIATPENGVRIFNNPDPVPRLVVTNDVLIESDFNLAMGRLVSGEWDPRRTVQIESGGLLRDSLACNAPFIATVDGIHYEPTEISLHVETSCPAVLVINDTDYPGWKARVDGRPVDLFRANLTFRGIHIPTGRSHVELSYSPASLKAGMAASLSSLGLLIGGLWWLRRRPDPLRIAEPGDP